MILVTEKAMKNYIKCMTMQNKKGVHIQSIFERFMFQMFPAVPLCCKQMIGPASITIYASPSWSQSKHRTLKKIFLHKTLSLMALSNLVIVIKLWPHIQAQ